MRHDRNAPVRIRSTRIEAGWRCTTAISLAAFWVCLASGAAFAAAAPTHVFVFTYRAFGPVTSNHRFRPAAGYAVRFEGCVAKHSEEAVCGFTLRATGRMSLTNVANLSHATGVDGAAIRTCCMFVQGDDRGYPITPAPAGPVGDALLHLALRSGETRGVMLRVPNYRAFSPVAGVTFSRGEGDPGVSFATDVDELP